MFERYTEKARRVIFFGRYEASQFGAPYIETEHLLLGLLREDKALTNRFLRSHASVESIRKQIEGHTTIRERVSTSVDLPLSNESKRVLAYAAEEAERLSHHYVGTEHLLLGLMREEKCFAAEVLHERGLRLSAVREQMVHINVEKSLPQQQRHSSPLAEVSRDLTQAAIENQLGPLIGRESEVDRLIQILCRRTNDNAVLIGEPGVGKRTIINGLAQRVADGAIPEVLADQSILAVDLSSLAAMEKPQTWRAKFRDALPERGTVFVVDELHMPNGPGKSPIQAEVIVKGLIVTGRIQCISLATPSGYAESTKNHGWLARCFQPIPVAPATETEAIAVLLGVKGGYEKFHAVIYDDDALTSAVYYANHCIKDGHLPGKAVDLVDEAGAHINLQPLPGEIGELQKRIKFIVHRMENAIANHEFEKARFYSEEERKERDNLRALREKYGLSETVTKRITREDVEDAVARKTGMSVVAIRQTLATDPNGPKTSHP
jgi:ATP-dependent Clp protease ATP-binding subunit ClpC